MNPHLYYTISLVNHPLRIAAIFDKFGANNSKETYIISDTATGPLGLRLYNIKTNNFQMVKLLKQTAAWKYKVVILTDVLNNYNMVHYQDMISALLFKTIGCTPNGFEVIRFADPKTTHLYPIYTSNIGQFRQMSDYLYVCSEEEKLIEFDPLSILGMSPLILSDKCWDYMQVGTSNSRSATQSRPIFWGGSAIIRSKDADSVVDDVEATQRLMNFSTRLICRNSDINSTI
jgi:hypothetical protein